MRAFTDREAQQRAKWMIVDREPKAHLLLTDWSTGANWRPLCQDSEVSSRVILREAIDGTDEFCGECRRVLGARLRLAIAKRRRGLR